MKAFDFSNVDLQEVKTKTRTTSDDKPYITTSTTPGRFNMNGLASQMLGTKSGDKVSFFEDGRIKDLDARFFIYAKETANCAALYSPAKSTAVGSALAFNLAGAYSRILQGDPITAELSMEKLEEKNLAVSRASAVNPKKRNYSALQVTRFELIEGPVVTIGEEDVQTFALVNPEMSDASGVAAEEAE